MSEEAKAKNSSMPPKMKDLIKNKNENLDDDIVISGISGKNKYFY